MSIYYLYFYPVYEYILLIFLPCIWVYIINTSTLYMSIYYCQCLPSQLQQTERQMHMSGHCRFTQKETHRILLYSKICNQSCFMETSACLILAVNIYKCPHFISTCQHSRDPSLSWRSIHLKKYSECPLVSICIRHPHRCVPGGW